MAHHDDADDSEPVPGWLRDLRKEAAEPLNTPEKRWRYLRDQALRKQAHFIKTPPPDWLLSDTPPSPELIASWRRKPEGD
ncbi:MAG TPA: hypothetical protein PKA13_08980 [Geminicoccaceae bacterium]|nr:hypothetical protein [Geminicoccaceae bacterium]